MKRIYLMAFILLAGCKARHIITATKDSSKVTHAVEKGIDTTRKTADTHKVESEHKIIITKSGKVIDITPHLGSASKVIDGNFYGVADHITTTTNDSDSNESYINSDFENHSELKKGIDTTKVKSEAVQVKKTDKAKDSKANNSYTYFGFGLAIIAVIAVGWYMKAHTKWLDFLKSK